MIDFEQESRDWRDQSLQIALDWVQSEAGRKLDDDALGEAWISKHTALLRSVYARGLEDALGAIPATDRGADWEVEQWREGTRAKERAIRALLPEARE